jgi:hypothetical protein
MYRGSEIYEKGNINSIEYIAGGNVAGMRKRR